MERTVHIMNDDELRRTAPSIFAEEPYEKVSDSYVFIPTINVLDAMRANGFFPVYAAQSRTRIEGKESFTKHMIRLRHANYMEKPVIVGDSIPEIVLVNSHDLTSAYELSIGVYRLACSNGMMVKSQDFGSYRTKHSGDIVGEVIEGSFRIIDEVPKLINHVEKFKGIQLNPNQREIYALAARELQYPTDDEGESTAPIQHTQLLTPRRFYDKGTDLWTTFNVVQENMIRGGIKGVGSTGRNMTTRAISSVTNDIRLNRSLWMLTEQMAQLMQ